MEEGWERAIRTPFFFIMEELLNKGLEYILKDPWTFAKAYKDLTGEEVCSYCPGKIEAKFNELINNKNKIKSMQQRKYRMIPGKLIYYNNNHYTDKNMTDELAETLISQGFGKYFKTVPAVEGFGEATPIKTNPVIKTSIKDLEEKEKEAEIKLEVFEKKTEEAKEEKSEEKKNSLDTYSRTRLVELCEKRNYPKEEWKDLVRKDLIKYVNGK
jgi:hypothetical protein